MNWLGTGKNINSKRVASCSCCGSKTIFNPSTKYRDRKNIQITCTQCLFTSLEKEYLHKSVARKRGDLALNS